MQLTEAKKELERRLFTAIDWFHVVLDRKPTVFMELADGKKYSEVNIVCSVDEEMVVLPLIYMIKKEVSLSTYGAGKVDQEPMKATAAYLKKCLEYVESKIDEQAD